MDPEIQVPEIQTTPEPSSEDNGGLANPFLEGVDEADREIVSKYINEWDAGVTKKFQELNGKLKPYEDLGVDVESIQHAVSVMRWADEDPAGFYQEVKNRIHALAEEGVIDMSMLEGDTPDPVGSNLPEFEGVPEQFVQRYQGLENQLNEVLEWKKNQESQAESQSRQQQLDNLFENLHNDHGDFDKAAVMGRILEGMSPEEAVKDYQKLVKEISTPKRQTPPSTLPGGGQSIREQVDSSKLGDKKTRTGLVTDLLKTIDS